MIKLRGVTKFYSTGYVKTFVLLNSREGREVMAMFTELDKAGTTPDLAA